MKKLLVGAVVLASLTAAPAMAEDFTVTGTVGAACSAIAPQPIAFGTINISNTTGKLVAGQTKSSAATPIWCNGINSTITFSGNTITTANTTSDAAFTSTLGFTPKVSVGGVDKATGANVGAVAADLIVTADTLTDGNKIPVAGTYTGTITVTLTPTA